jgi:hypothetical protein
MLAVEFSLDVSWPVVHLTTIYSLKRIDSQEHIHFMRDAATRLEGKLDNVQEAVNDGFQVRSLGMITLVLS